MSTINQAEASKSLEQSTLLTQ